MQIWVDADACPKAIKEILFRAAARSRVVTVFVANQLIQTPLSPYIKKILVVAGFDVADNQIIQNTQSGDLVITADIPLANAVIDNGCLALNPRGELYNKDNIGQRLNLRNFNEELRGSGVNIGGPAKISPREIQKFANCLDKLLNSEEYKNMPIK